MMTLDFDLLFHNPNPAIDAYLHGDHTHTNEDGEEVVSPGTPDRPVVIEPEPEPDPDPPNANPGPAPAPEPSDEPKILLSTRPGEVLIGGDNDDTLEGGAIMAGGPGNDTITLANSSVVNYETIMIGGPGADVFDVEGVEQLGGVRIIDFQDGVDKIKYPYINSEGSSYQLAAEAGLQWDMNWIADELGNGVAIEHEGPAYHGDLTILGVRIENLQIEIVGDDVFLV